jgi:hypothetical protein
MQVKEVIAELLGKVDGAARGLGGSMHLYKREHNFFGGEGIVGTHVRPALILSFRLITRYFLKTFAGDKDYKFQYQSASAEIESVHWHLPSVQVCFLQLGLWVPFTGASRGLPRHDSCFVCTDTAGGRPCICTQVQKRRSCSIRAVWRRRSEPGPSSRGEHIVSSCK